MQANINLEKVVRVRIEDSSNYEPFSNNGLFWTDYRRVAGGWEVFYGTSSDMGCCPVCGAFEDHIYFDEESEDYEYQCGNFEVVPTFELLKNIQIADEKKDCDVIYTQEWQNTDMDRQPIYQWNSGNCIEPRQSNWYTVYSFDRKRRWEVTPHAIHLVDEDGFEAFSYYPEYCTMEEDGYDVELCIFNFLHHSEELFSDGTTTDVYNDKVAEAMMEMSEKLGLGWVSEECYNSEEYSDYYRIYAKDFAEKCYIGQDVSFIFTAEALVEALAEGEGYSDYKKHSVIMMYPDGSYDEDEAYVIHHGVKTVVNQAQRSVIMHEITRLENEMEHIDAIWKKRGIKDATAEPEFVEYEKMLMIRCELGLGVE